MPKLRLVKNPNNNYITYRVDETSSLKPQLLINLLTTHLKLTPYNTMTIICKFDINNIYSLHRELWEV